MRACLRAFCLSACVLSICIFLHLYVSRLIMCKFKNLISSGQQQSNYFVFTTFPSTLLASSFSFFSFHLSVMSSTLVFLLLLLCKAFYFYYNLHLSYVLVYTYVPTYMCVYVCMCPMQRLPAV